MENIALRFALVTFCLTCSLISAMPEQGIKDLLMIPDETYRNDHYAGISRSMNAGSRLAVEIKCTAGLEVRIEWIMRSSFCANEFLDYDDENYDALNKAFLSTNIVTGEEVFDNHKYITSDGQRSIVCSSNGTIILENFTNRMWQDVIHRSTSYRNNEAQRLIDRADSEEDDGDGPDATEENRLSQDEEYGEKDKGIESVYEEQAAVVYEHSGRNLDLRGGFKHGNDERTNEVDEVENDRDVWHDPESGGKRSISKRSSPGKTADVVKDESQPVIPGALVVVPLDSIYMFIMHVIFDENKGSVNVSVRTFDDYGYLSAIDWPLLPFYGLMVTVYGLLFVFWLAACCWYRKDLLHIQSWIAVVILTCLIEEASFACEYYTTNLTGKSVPGVVVVGEIVSCAKRALCRMLLIVISVGYGIVKPRLGPTLRKVVAVGLGYFILSTIEGFSRATTHKANQQTNWLMCLLIALAATDLVILCWMVIALVRTRRIVRSKNFQKLSVYFHFTNTFILSVLASLAFMIWSIVEHKRAACLTNWKTLWVDEAFWHIAFTVFLIVIMILFRPSAVNQRYVDSLEQMADGEVKAVVTIHVFKQLLDELKTRRSNLSKDTLSGKELLLEQDEKDRKSGENENPGKDQEFGNRHDCAQGESDALA